MTCFPYSELTSSDGARPARRIRRRSGKTSTIARSLLTHQGTWAVIDYRFRRRLRAVPGPLGVPLLAVAALSRKVIEISTGISISSGAEIGPGFYIGHFSGIVVGRGVHIGENCNISQGVTVGSHRGSPRIGDDVYLGPGAKLFGPISVGDHVAVGANAVVSRSVPSFSTVVTGQPTVLDNAPRTA